jgi:hypothetical protein
MKRLFKYLLGVFAVFFISNSCTNTTYTLGDLTAPTNVVIKADIVGATTAAPNGDGSGNVVITVTADNALGYNVNYDANTSTSLVFLPTGSITKKYTTLGTNTYRITAVVYGKGGTSSTISKDVTVKFDYVVDPTIATNLTGGTSKTWVVDKSVAGHFGLGPWSNSSVTPEWWAAGINEKVSCCNCFYTSTFTFTKVASNGSYSLKVTCPDGAFTKTGSLTSLPGIPGSGAEACYSYNGGTGAFSFVPSSSGIASTASAPSTKVAIVLADNSTFIGYGSLQKEYEILVLTADYMYLRVQGTETGNTWYIKLKAI